MNPTSRFGMWQGTQSVVSGGWEAARTFGWHPAQVSR